MCEYDEDVTFFENSHGIYESLEEAREVINDNFKDAETKYKYICISEADKCEEIYLGTEFYECYSNENKLYSGNLRDLQTDLSFL